MGIVDCEKGRRRDRRESGRETLRRKKRQNRENVDEERKRG